MMIANCATVLIGLWLIYRAIFSIPPGNINEAELVAAGIAVIVLSWWARRTDAMAWHSWTNMALAVIILLLAAVRQTAGIDPLVLFWMILLISITAAVVAMWSVLYRPKYAGVLSAR